MKQIVTNEQMRAYDAATIEGGISSRELMKRAGEAVFGAYPWRGRVAIVCGVGNNAGDGYVLALCLKRAGVACRLLLWKESFSEDGDFYFQACVRENIPWSVFDGEADFSQDGEIVDCLFGTGFHGNAEGAAADLIRAINRSGLPVIAVDINSGLNGTSGQGTPFVRSTLTLAIGYCKAGLLLGNGKDATKRIEVVDIGIPIPQGERVACLAEQGDFHSVLQKRAENSHKGSYGYVALIGGCTAYAGAVKLANLSCAALRAGCGVATLAVSCSLCPSVSPHLLESTLFPMEEDETGCMRYDPHALDRLTQGKRVVAVGMGWGSGDAYGEILTHLLTTYQGSLLIDADGLNTLSKMDKSLLKKASCRVLLTPHAKEMERLSHIPVETILQDPIGVASRYAKENGVCLLLKGPTTVVTDGDTTWLVNRGCAGMATAGSGDVLSGILTGLLGYAPLTPQTVACGAYLAGRAGELAEARTNPISMLASDTVHALPDAIREEMER